MAKNGTGLIVSNFNGQSYTQACSPYLGLAPIESPIRTYKTTEEAIQVEFYGKKPFVDPGEKYYSSLDFMERSNQAVGRCLSYPFRTMYQFTSQVLSNIVDYTASSIKAVWEHAPTLLPPMALAQQSTLTSTDNQDKRIEHLLYQKIGAPLSNTLYDKVESKTEEGNKISQELNVFNQNVINGLMKRIKASKIESAYVIDCIEDVDEVLVYIPHFLDDPQKTKELVSSDNSKNRINIRVSGINDVDNTVNNIITICTYQEKAKNTRCVQDLGRLEERTVDCLENNCHWVDRLQIEKTSKYFENEDITSTIQNVVERMPPHLQGKNVIVFSTYRGRTLANRWELSRHNDRIEPTGIINASNGRWRKATEQEVNKIKLALTLIERHDRNEPLNTLPSHLLGEVCDSSYLKKYENEKKIEKAIGMGII